MITNNYRMDWENDEAYIAMATIMDTNYSLFLTGKAGTGKTSLAKHIINCAKKKTVILAPTGKSALNIEGETIHKFFCLPPSLLDKKMLAAFYNINPEKVKLLKDLELLVIDEVSMVRADLIDAIDFVLRKTRNQMNKPFGGVQLFLLGDLFQLRPILKKEQEKEFFHDYADVHFFNAKVFKEFELVNIELKKVYRQRDKYFIELLDRIRYNTLKPSDYVRLNQRIAKESDLGLWTIFLSSRNEAVEKINYAQLQKSNFQLFEIPPICNGNIQREEGSSILYLREHSKVVITCNDYFGRYANGTIGYVSSVSKDRVNIETEDRTFVSLRRRKEKNITFKYVEGKVEKRCSGWIKQFPIKLGYAMTIHKSQGLTFKNVCVDVQGGIYSSEQLYVAISRCESLNGIYLNGQLKPKNYGVNENVVEYYQKMNDPKRINQIVDEVLSKPM